MVSQRSSPAYDYLLPRRGTPRTTSIASSRTSRRANQSGVLREQTPPLPHGAQAIAQAYLFPLMGPRRIARVQYDPEDSSQPGGLPRVHSNYFFECRQSTLNKVYDAIVEVGSHRFKVYGWRKGGRRGIPNHHLRQIKPSTVWRGEIMVICLGTRKAFLSRPRMVISAIEEVVSIFISRMTEYLDCHRRPPHHILSRPDEFTI